MGTKDLPDHVTAEAEPLLLEAASRLDPPQLRRAIGHLLLVADPDGADAKAERDHERRGLWLTPTFEGVVAVDGLLEADAGGHDQLLGHPDEPHPGHGASAHAPPPTCWGPSSRDLGLETQLRAAMTQLPPILGGAPSRPLDVGRTTRVISPAQRTALAVRDGGCVFPGCQRPLAWCDAHHLWRWIDGGPTDLLNLVLLCRAHHRAVHEGGWRLQRDPDGRFIAIPPHRRPRRTPGHHRRQPAIA